MSKLNLESFAGLEIDQLSEEELSQLDHDGFNKGDLSYENIFRTTHEALENSISKFQIGLRLIKERSDFLRMKPKTIPFSDDLWMAVYEFVREAMVTKMGQNNQDQVGPSSPVTLNQVFHYGDLHRLVAIAHDAVHGDDSTNKMVWKYGEAGIYLLAPNPLYLPRCTPYIRAEINGLKVFFFAKLMVCMDLMRINYPENFQLDDRTTWTNITSPHPGVLAMAFFVSRDPSNLGIGRGYTGKGVISCSLNEFNAVQNIGTAFGEKLSHNFLTGDNLPELIKLEESKGKNNNFYMILEPLVNKTGGIASEKILYKSQSYFWSIIQYNGSTYPTFRASKALCGVPDRDIDKIEREAAGTRWVPPSCKQLKYNAGLIHTAGNCYPPITTGQRWFRDLELSVLKTQSFELRDKVSKSDLVNFMETVCSDYNSQGILYIETNELARKLAIVFEFTSPYMITQYGRYFKSYVHLQKEKSCKWYIDFSGQESESDWESNDNLSSVDLENEHKKGNMLTKLKESEGSPLPVPPLSSPISLTHSLSPPKMPPFKMRKTLKGSSISLSSSASTKEERKIVSKSGQPSSGCKISKKRRRRDSDEEDDDEYYDYPMNTNNIHIRQ